jgi:hypothetical protein
MSCRTVVRAASVETASAVATTRAIAAANGSAVAVDEPANPNPPHAGPAKNELKVVAEPRPA